MATLRLRAHAKVNLYLRVLGRRNDGYHDVETLLHSIDLADYMELSDEIDGFKLIVRAAGPAGESSWAKEAVDELFKLPSDGNIVASAMKSVERFAGRTLPTEIKLAKRIPVGAGMGGGSADAAATLLGLRKLHELAMTDAELGDVAEGLGADVPFFLHGGTSLATGTGADVIRLPDPPPLWLVLGVGKRPLLTKDVYAAWDETGSEPGPAVGTMLKALMSGDVSNIAAAMHNDLQSVALVLRPELEDGLTAMQSAGALRALVSGSGPTIFGLCESADHARSVTAAVRGSFDHTQVTCSQSRAIELLN